MARFREVCWFQGGTLTEATPGRLKVLRGEQRPEGTGKLEVGGASRHSTGFGALEEGLISS